MFVFDPSLEELDDPICRICWEKDPVSELISPCNCSGSIKYIHRGCLDEWYALKVINVCPTCKAQMRRTWIGFKPLSLWRDALVRAFNLQEVPNCPFYYMKYFALEIVDPCRTIMNMMVFAHILLAKNFCFNYASGLLDCDYDRLKSRFAGKIAKNVGRIVKSALTALSLVDWTKSTRSSPMDFYAKVRAKAKRNPYVRTMYRVGRLLYYVGMFYGYYKFYGMPFVIFGLSFIDSLLYHVDNGALDDFDDDMF